MTQDEIIRMAREAGVSIRGHYDETGSTPQELERFFKLAFIAGASNERENRAKQEPPCNPHPDAPHGFDRNASHNAGRYVCECEGWSTEQEYVALDITPEVNLTDSEIIDIGCILDTVNKVSAIDFARAVIQKYKEKNRG